MNQQPLHPAVLRLVVDGQVQPDAGFPLPPSDIVLGRDPSCDLVLDAYSSVSRRHAAIRVDRSHNQWIIQDLNSSNGTFVNGQRIQGESVLNDRDRIRLGTDGPEFQFEFELATASIPATVSQPVVTRETIEESNYRIEILPTKLIIHRKNGGISSWGGIGCLMIFLLFSFPVILPLIVLVFAFVLAWDTCYTFDRETEQFTIDRTTLARNLFGRRRSQSHPIAELTAVRLRKSAYQGDEGTQYDDYAIFLDRESGRSIKLGFNWRQDARNQGLQKAEEMVENIERFLMRP